MNLGNMTSAHFIFIPAAVLIGIVIGWILGSRAARDVVRRGIEAARGARAAENLARRVTSQLHNYATPKPLPMAN